MTYNYKSKKLKQTIRFYTSNNYVFAEFDNQTIQLQSKNTTLLFFGDSEERFKKMCTNWLRKYIKNTYIF